MFREKNKHFKDTQKMNFDRGHRATEQPEIPNNTEVWVTSEREPIRGRVVSSAGQPRSYVVETPTGQIQRNRNHLNVIPEQPPENTEATETETTTPTSPAVTEESSPNVIMTRSRTGTQIRPPDRLA